MRLARGQKERGAVNAHQSCEHRAVYWDVARGQISYGHVSTAVSRIRPPLDPPFRGQHQETPGDTVGRCLRCVPEFTGR